MELRIGAQYNYFTLLEVKSVKKGVTSPRQVMMCRCRCVCGKEVWIAKYNITHNKSKSCGCQNFKHNGRNTRLYGIWRGVKRRCNTPTANTYKHYGARGIKVCKEWNDSFVSFRDWATANGYNDTLTIDRIDVNGNYEPGNCRWVSMKVQANNKRNSVLITYNGESHTASQWSDICGVSAHRISGRLRLGWSVGEALGYISHKRKIREAATQYVTIGGVTKTYEEWLHLSGVSLNTVRMRLKKGYTLEQALTLKPFKRLSYDDYDEALKRRCGY